MRDTADAVVYLVQAACAESPVEVVNSQLPLAPESTGLRRRGQWSLQGTRGLRLPTQSGPPKKPLGKISLHLLPHVDKGNGSIMVRRADAIQITCSSRNRSISLQVYPPTSSKISSVCCPNSGSGRRMARGVALAYMGWPTTRDLP